MSDIKLDPVTKIKWVEYKNTTPLTDAEDTQLKQFLQGTYTSLINATLNNLKLPACSADLKMITTASLGNIQLMTYPLFGVYKQSDVDLRLKESKLDETLKDNLEVLYLQVSNRLNLQIDIETIKKKFRECASNNYFVVSLQTYPLRNISKEEVYVGHQNILIIAKNRGVVYWIEPLTTVNPTYESQMISSIKKLVTEIGMTDPTVINPVETCPQLIAGDRNCIFWAYIIFFLTMLNVQERDHNVLIKQFMAKYPTKEALTNYVNGFKRFLYSMAFSSRAGRRRTLKRKLHKKRKTIRRK